MGGEAADVDELCTSLDWLLPRQNRIKNKLAKPHPEDGEDEARLVKPTELIPIEAHFLELLEPRA